MGAGEHREVAAVPGFGPFLVVVVVGQVGAVVDQQPRDVAAGLVGGDWPRRSTLWPPAGPGRGRTSWISPSTITCARVWSMVPSASAVHTAGTVHDPQGCVHQIPAERAEVTVIAATVATAPDTRVAHLVDPVVDHRDHRRPPRIHRAQVGFDVAQRRGEVFIVEVFQCWSRSARVPGGAAS